MTSNHLIKENVSSIVNKFIDEKWEILENKQFSNFEKIHLAAEYFKNDLDEIESLIKNFEIKYKILQNLRHKLRSGELAQEDSIWYERQNKKFWAAFKSENVKQKLIKLYNSMYEFQKILNEALGQKVQMMYAIGGKKVGFYEFNTEATDLNFYFSKTGKLTAHYYFTQNQLENMTNIAEHEENFKFSLKGLNNTYNEVLYRYNKAREKKRYIILWRLGQNKWQGVQVYSRGVLGEAYGIYILKNNKNPSFEKQIEYNVKDFMTNAFVDSVSGLLRGDFTKKNDDGQYIEYAIKSANASTLGLEQMKKLANEIVNDKNFSINNLRQKKKELDNIGITNHFSDVVEEEALESLNIEDLKNFLELRIK